MHEASPFPHIHLNTNLPARCLLFSNEGGWSCIFARCLVAEVTTCRSRGEDGVATPELASGFEITARVKCRRRVMQKQAGASASPAQLGAFAGWEIATTAVIAAEASKSVTRTRVTMTCSLETQLRGCGWNWRAPAHSRVEVKLQGPHTHEPLCRSRSDHPSPPRGGPLHVTLTWMSK